MLKKGMQFWLRSTVTRQVYGSQDELNNVYIEFSDVITLD